MILWGFLPRSASALAAGYHVVLSRGASPTCGGLMIVVVDSNSGRGNLFATSLNLSDLNQNNPVAGDH